MPNIPISMSPSISTLAMNWPITTSTSTIPILVRRLVVRLGRFVTLGMVLSE